MLFVIEAEEMANKLQDSDNDDYELMMRPSSAKHRKENSYMEAEREKGSQPLQENMAELKFPSMERKTKEEVTIKKPMNKFMQHFKRGNVKNKAVKPVAGLSIGKHGQSAVPPAVNAGAQISSDAMKLQQPAQILTLNAPPKVSNRVMRVHVIIIIIIIIPRTCTGWRQVGRL